MIVVEMSVPLVVSVMIIWAGGVTWGMLVWDGDSDGAYLS